MKFFERRRVIEAEQFLGGAHPDPPGILRDRDRSGAPYIVVTSDGQRRYVQPGEWIVQTLSGEHYYTMSADSFEQLYEPL